MMLTYQRNVGLVQDWYNPVVVPGVSYLPVSGVEKAKGNMLIRILVLVSIPIQYRVRNESCGWCRLLSEEGKGGETFGC